MKYNIIKQVSIFILIALIICTLFTGCSKIKILSNNSLKREIPELKYDELGYGFKTSIDGNALKITYALVGFLKDEPKYLRIDQIEKELGDETSLSTNREKGNSYGLAYTSDYGEWYVQLDALQNYILGHKMTLEDIEKIETYKKDEKNTSLPAKDSDLAVACNLNIEDFLDVVKLAYKNTVKHEANYIGIGEDIKIYNTTESAKITFAILAYDYNNIINYSHLESFEAKAGDKEVLSLREKAENDTQLNKIQNSVTAYEEYMIGRTTSDAANVEVYSTADGSALALPKPGTDLAQVCNIDLKYYINAIFDASNRAG